MSPYRSPTHLRPRLAGAQRAATLVAAALASAAVYAAAPAAHSNLPPMQDIHDIRPPFHISQEWLWLAVACGCFLVAALAIAAWRWRRRKMLARRMSAHELALARLREARSLMSQELARDFSIAVSGIIRTYIEQRFDIRAAHRTTPEFLRDCSTGAGGLLAAHREILEVFLQHCDLAKFARWVLSVSEMQDILASAIDFVTKTAATASATPADRKSRSSGDVQRLHTSEAAPS